MEAEAKAKALQKLLDAEREKQQYEYLALAGQVSPHILSNMLLDWKGQVERDKRGVMGEMEKTYQL